MSEIREAMANNPPLRDYIYEFKRNTGRIPVFHDKLSVDMDEMTLHYPDVIYPLGGTLFAHVYGSRENGMKYHVIEPKLNEEEEEKYKRLLAIILEKAAYEETPKSKANLSFLIDKLLKKSVIINGGKDERHGWFSNNHVPVTDGQLDNIGYMIKRNIIGNSEIEALMRDPYLEDIHCIGSNDNLFIVHKVFGMLETNIRFRDDFVLIDYLRSMSEQIGRPASESSPIIDGAMEDGSRVNIVFSDDVSYRGPSFTIRKFSEVPYSITELMKWGTFSPEIAAYIWLCIEHGMSTFICGETASGKTTSLNSLLSFINEDAKVFSAENTPELRSPQRVWQQLITREGGGEGSRVYMFDLLKTALRSRPNYIIVGEIRGEEGNMAFQAIQTGHPVMSTFHASSVKKMIQRLIGTPINVPLKFIDNLNVAIFQQAVYKRGELIRRCISVDEIEGYIKEVHGIVTRTVFEWDPIQDKHIFRGMNNSFILENKIAKKIGYEDRRDVYVDMVLRAKILDEMVARDILNYFEVNKVIQSYYKKGLAGLPFSL
jgi:flagellar protein FlaI